MVNNLNLFLSYDGYEIIQNGNIFSIKYTNQQQSGTVKNLIFASDGPKPDLILKDTLTYEIEVVTNQKHILIYDQPIPNDGLKWNDLAAWWANKYNVYVL